MKKDYRRTATTVSMINYHFVFCPRYRRKIFNIDGVENRFKETVVSICEQNNINIIAVECDKDHCHLFINCPPTLSPAKIMCIIKSNTARMLKTEFERLSTMQNVWTRSYFVSTAGEVSSATIENYVKSQKTKYI